MLFGPKKSVSTNDDKKQKFIDQAFENLQKLKKLRGKREINKDSTAFFHIVKRFFAGYYKIRYKFTYEELSAELTSHRMKRGLSSDLNKLISELSLVEYSHKPLTPEDLSSLIGIFGHLMHRLSKTGAKANNKSGKERVHHSIIHRKILDIRNAIHRIHSGRAAKSRAMKVDRLLTKAHELLEKGNLLEARRLYEEIGGMFSRLSLEEKKERHPRILRLYETIVATQKSLY